MLSFLTPRITARTLVIAAQPWKRVIEATARTDRPLSKDWRETHGVDQN
jgi:hypothetical protein